ncbi:MAG TPA: hypothetical protein VE173_03920 [Longimicrobiales bacterium]|nr:hypothetical protein [Longimicrobiales bacterium]
MKISGVLGAVVMVSFSVGFATPRAVVAQGPPTVGELVHSFREQNGLTLHGYYVGNVLAHREPHLSPAELEALADSLMAIALGDNRGLAQYAIMALGYAARPNLAPHPFAGSLRRLKTIFLQVEDSLV